ncbi:MAG: hypothetical protein ACI4UC_00370, partial [Alloprevotella sp.]
ILAVFHSSSAGQTREAGSVWQSDLPYLQPVDSPEDGESIPNYYSRAEFTAEEFREKFLAACPEADLSGNMSGWLKNAVTDSAGNHVLSVTVPRSYSSMTMLFSAPELLQSGTYAIKTGCTLSGGTDFQGLVTGGTASGGSQLKSFTTSSKVTTVR